MELNMLRLDRNLDCSDGGGVVNSESSSTACMPIFCTLTVKVFSLDEKYTSAAEKENH